MKVFVAGATGAVGHRAVRSLSAAGHEVTGVARSPAKAALLEQLGAVPTTVDLFDPASVRDAVTGHDAVVNLATHIPPTSKAWRPSAWATNDRLRREASNHLVDGALGAGAAVYVQESLAFTYPDRGAEWIDETVSLETAGVTDAVAVAEAATARFAAEGSGRGVALRFGMFYGPQSHHTEAMVRAARRRWAMDLGDPDAYWSMVHLDDAAAAVPVALQLATGAYNVVDDVPMTRRDLYAALADALGVAPPRFLPRAVKHLAGKRAAAISRSERVSNGKLRRASSWAPDFPSVREGFPATIAGMGEEAVDA